jgi:hypothetical protein
MGHPKEQMIIDWIKKITVERQSKYLGYKLKYGRYRNQTLHDVFKTKQGVLYILWLKQHTTSTHFKKIISRAAVDELRLTTV